MYNFSQNDRFSHFVFASLQPEEQDLGQRVQVRLRSILSLFVADTGPTALSAVILKPLFPRTDMEDSHWAPELLSS